MNLATVLFTLVSLAQLITGNFFFLVNSVNTLRKYTYKTSKIHYSAGYSALAIRLYSILTSQSAQTFQNITCTRKPYNLAELCPSNRLTLQKYFQRLLFPMLHPSSGQLYQGDRLQRESSFACQNCFANFSLSVTLNFNPQLVLL